MNKSMEEVSENNKLIAEFMGLKINPHDGGRTVGINAFLENGEWWAEDWKIPLYHKSWDWLMPVIDKIDGLTTENFYDLNPTKNDFATSVVFETENLVIITVSLKGYEKYKTKQFSFREKNKIESAYFAALDFIKWYNHINPTE